jgi:predicted transcriptional regulator
MGGKRSLERVVVAGHRLPAAEAEILRILLAAERPLLVAEVRDRLPGRTRAHTTVITLLDRLLKRGLVRRQGDNRGHRYAPAGTEQELAVAALNDVVAGIDDPALALVAFINRLPATTRRGVRRALGDQGDQGDQAP